MNWEKFDEALKAHEKALEVEPGNTFSRVHYGEALLIKKQKDKGIVELRKVLEADPNSPDAALARNLIRGAEQGLFAKL
jgi:predicted Zn-dependent protease